MKRILGLLLLSSIANAYTITHNDYTSNSAVTAAGQNTNENNIVNLLNGNIDTTNISSSAGILYSQLAANTITNSTQTAKVNGTYATSLSTNTITTTGGTILGIGHCDLAFSADGSSQIDFNVMVLEDGANFPGNSTRFFVAGVSQLSNQIFPMPISFMRQPSAGTHNYSVGYTANHGSYVGGSSQGCVLDITEFKR